MAGPDESVGRKDAKETLFDGVNNRRKVPAFKGGVARAAGKQGVAREEHWGVFEREADRTGGVAGGMGGPDTKVADLDDVIVFEQGVVTGQHGGVLVADPDPNAGLPDGLDGLDVIPMTVRLDDLAHPQVAGDLEESVVLVGGVNKEGLATSPAPDHVNVVFHRSDHETVDFGGGIGPNEGYVVHVYRMPRRRPGGGAPSERDPAQIR